MIREQLASYWPVILLYAGVVALPVYATLSAGGGLAALAAGRPDYPVRIELVPVVRASSTMMALEDLTGPGLVAILTGEAETETGEPSASEAADSVPLAVQAHQSASPSSAGGLLAISFDLADPAGAADVRDGNGAVEARKGVRLDGVDAGSAAIRISSTSALFIARDEFRNLLDASGHKDLAERVASASSGFVSFDEIRRLGFGVRYDPVTDRILVST